MVYTRNQPVGSDDLDISQPFLTTNTNAADDSFGVDHYKFSDATSNNGFHNTVTTPVFVDNPPTGLPPVTVAIPKLFGFQNSANIGILQYSKGPTTNPLEPTVPTPLTCLQSRSAGFTIANAATIDILDFTGSPGVIAKLYAASMSAGIPAKLEALVVWNGLSISIINQYFPGGLTAISGGMSGEILRIQNGNVATLNSVVWTLDFMRIA